MVEKHLRIPNGVWAWPGTALVVAVLALPVLVRLWLEPDDRNIETAAVTVSLAAHPLILAAAIILYFAWRLTFDHGLAWLSTAFTAIAIEGISLAGLRAASGGDLSDSAAELMFVDLLCVACVVTMLVVGRRTPPPFDPVVLGFGLGILISALRIGLLEGTHGVAATWVLGIAIALRVLLYLGFAGAVARLGTGPSWARGRLTAAVLLLGVNRLIPYPALDEPATGTLALLTDAGGAILLCTAALSLLRLAIQESASTVSALNRRMEQVEARNRIDRERLHEINAAIAGIATASRLIHDETVLPFDRRVQLERMVQSEIDRLAGMIGPTRSAIREVDLDEAVEPVVTAQRILGRSVEWTPSGHRVMGRQDEIAEILTTLLENAAQHAPGSPVWIATRDVDTRVELTVSDVGPGIAPEVSDRIFDWGERNPDSNGEGIGLCVAKRLAKGMNGSLSWVPTNDFGAVFVVQLELARMPHGATSIRA